MPKRRQLRIVTVAWLFGCVWFTVTASPLLTTYARALGCNEFAFGLINALPFAATVLTLPTSALIDATGQRKAFFLSGLYSQRCLWLVIALLPLALFPRHASVPELEAATPAIVTVFLLLYFVQQGGQGVGGPAWTYWMAEIVPTRIRGRYFAKRRQLGLLTAVPALLLVGFCLDHFTGGSVARGDATPEARYRVVLWCSLLFLATAVAGILDIVCFQFLPHTPRPSGSSGEHFLARLLVPLRQRQFVLFVSFVSAMFFSNGLLGQFLNRYVQETVLAERHWLGLNLMSQLMLQALPGVVTGLTFPVWGRAVDRMGKKPLLYVGACGFAPVAALWMLVTPGTWWLGFAVATVTAVFWTGVEVTNLSLLLEMAAGDAEGDEGGSKGGGSSYGAINAALTAVAAFVGGIVGGIVAEALKDFSWTPVGGLKTFTRFDVLFALCAVVRIAAAVIVLPRLKEPDAAHPMEAARYMIENLYASAGELMRVPGKIVGRRREMNERR
jgi:MFS family permease